ncbi:hypothetical protein BRC97_04295 [Halobacteriales archaeon QS_6_71_20]|nr:MAG: hypothetical protein BRC97_04295 [Halobacteriales archaeon QS_6_71_20]
MGDGNSFVERLERRRFLRLSGAAGAAGLAGCAGRDELQGATETGGDSGGDTDSGGSEGDTGTDGTDSDGGEPITVGTVIPFSGDLADFGGPMPNAMRMAREDINAAGTADPAEVKGQLRTRMGRDMRGRPTYPAEVKGQLRTVSNPEGETVGYAEFERGVSLLDEGTEIDYSGPSGTVDYDENGDVASDMVIVEVQDGQFTDRETIPADELV